VIISVRFSNLFLAAPQQLPHLRQHQPHRLLLPAPLLLRLILL
jgi:hypothetical protein